MRPKIQIAKIFALTMILALPLVLSGCGKKPVTVPADNANVPIDQTGGLTPSEEASGTNRFETGPQNIQEIKTDADIENILKNIDNGDKSDQIKTIDESDINKF